jgi:hypothetical protein
VWPQSFHADLVRPATRWPDHTVAYTAVRHTTCRRIGCGWPVAGRAAAQAAGDPGRIRDPGILCGQPWGGGFFYLKTPENSFPLFKNPRKSILTPKITKPLPENF